VTWVEDISDLEMTWSFAALVPPLIGIMGSVNVSRAAWKSQ